MSVDFEAWTRQAQATRCYLVEVTFLKKADLSTVTLYLSTHAYPDAARRRSIVVDKPYAPCVKSVPRLTRTAGSILEPDRQPSWGELVLFTKPDYKPDLPRSLSWNTLLSGAYTAWGQPVTIRLGDPAWDYADFRVIFSGRCTNLFHDDLLSTLTLADKSADFSQKYPDYELPAIATVVESNWNKPVWLIMGYVKNYRPVLMSNSGGGSFPYQYALACHVVNALSAVYLDNLATAAPGNWELVQKGLSPVNADDAEGAAVMSAIGPYTGVLRRGNWLIEIDSITALNSQGNSGPEVGLATFRWSTDGGRTWQDSGILTWLLAYDSTTLAKNPAVGNATMAISGDYTGDVKLIYKIKVATGGYIGGATAPQFVWSDDNGVTWSAPVDILNNDPIPLNRGLSAAFTGSSGYYVPAQTWSPVGGAPGELVSLAVNPADNVSIEITAGGYPGVDAMFRWDAGAGWSAPQLVESSLGIWGGGSGYAAGDLLEVVQSGAAGMQATVVAVDGGGGVTAVRLKAPGSGYSVADGLGTTTSGGGSGCQLNVRAIGPYPITLFAGHIVGFTEPGGDVTAPPTNDYDAGDAGASYAAYVQPFVVNDLWTFTFKEVPIPLADGVSIQFATGAGQDFYLGDKFSFILMSILKLRAVEDTTEVTVDAEGFESPATGAYTDLIGEMIRAGAMLLLGWEAGDFDAEALAAFNAAFPYQAGLGVESPTEFGAIVQRLLGGIPAIYSVTLDGRFRLTELTPPSGTPALIINDASLQGRPQHGNSEEDKQIYRRVYLTYDRNYSPTSQTRGITQERLEWVKNDTRQVSARDDEVQQIFHLATDLGPLDTCLILRDDAKAVAEKDLALFRVEWDEVSADLKTQPYILEISEIVELRRPKFGLDSGKLYNLHGLDLDFEGNRSTVKLWG